MFMMVSLLAQVISPVGEVESVDAIRNGEQQLVAVAVTTWVLLRSHTEPPVGWATMGHQGHQGHQGHHRPAVRVIWDGQDSKWISSRNWYVTITRHWTLNKLCALHLLLHPSAHHVTAAGTKSAQEEKECRGVTRRWVLNCLRPTTRGAAHNWRFGRSGEEVTPANGSKR